MYQCHVCGSTKAREGAVDEVFQIDDRPVLVRRIPAMICTRCGEETFSQETTERIRRMVHGDAQPIQSVSMDVFSYV